MKDYYYILGVNKNASKEEIKKAYRKLSLKLHPDQNNGDKFFEERFREINEAHEVLTDDVKRKLYDLQFNQNLKGASPNNYSTNESQGSKGTDSDTQNYSFKQQSKDKYQETKSEYTPPNGSQRSTNKKSSKGLRNFVLTVVCLLILYAIKTIVSEYIRTDTLKKYEGSLKNQLHDSQVDTATIAVNSFPADTASYALNNSKNAMTLQESSELLFGKVTCG